MLVATLIFGIPWVSAAAEASGAGACVQWERDVAASGPTGWGAWSQPGTSGSIDAWTVVFSPGMPTTIVGKVYSGDVIVTDDGQVFHVARADRGFRTFPRFGNPEIHMLAEHMGREVEVKGNVVASGGKNTIFVDHIRDIG
jgi:hypothetical protein